MRKIAVFHIIVLVILLVSCSAPTRPIKQLTISNPTSDPVEIETAYLVEGTTLTIEGNSSITADVLAYEKEIDLFCKGRYYYFTKQSVILDGRTCTLKPNVGYYSLENGLHTTIRLANISGQYFFYDETGDILTAPEPSDLAPGETKYLLVKTDERLDDGIEFWIGLDKYKTKRNYQNPPAGFVIPLLINSTTEVIELN